MTGPRPAQNDSIAPCLQNPADPVVVADDDPMGQGIDWAQLGVPTGFRPFLMRLDINDSHMGFIINHVPNTEYVRWFEILATAHATALGYTDQWYQQHNRIWFVHRTEIDYLAEVCNGDRLLMATWVESFDKISSTRRYLIHRPSDGRHVAAGMTRWVFVDRTTHRPCRITDEMIHRFRGSASDQAE
ncbi:MAG: acyl-CoA thioesterase [Planctomycetes bacterium]|nr:acyl-CoA thioesterase [Planctomycetota bacterium]NOG56093.1 acyl-CoA thioesterase [Planctomycetota bacterium]